MKSRQVLLGLLALVALWLVFGQRKSFLTPSSGYVRPAPPGRPQFYFKNDGELCDTGYTQDPKRPLACIKS